MHLGPSEEALFKFSLIACLSLHFISIQKVQREMQALDWGEWLLCLAGNNLMDVWVAHHYLKIVFWCVLQKPWLGFKECDCSDIHYQKASEFVWNRVTLAFVSGCTFQRRNFFLHVRLHCLNWLWLTNIIFLSVPMSLMGYFPSSAFFFFCQFLPLTVHTSVGIFNLTRRVIALIVHWYRCV